MNANRYRIASMLILVAYCYAAFFIVAMGVFMAAEVLHHHITGVGWAITVAVIGLVLLGVATSGFQWVRGKRADGFYTRVFPGFAGDRIPLFDLLSLAGPGGSSGFRRADVVYSLGVAEDHLFVLRNGRHADLSKPVGGKIVDRPGDDAYLTFERRAIVAVEVTERSDEEIKGAAVDNRDMGDRMTEEVINRMVGRKVKHKIVPYAAYVHIVHRRADGDEILDIAIPTEVPSEVLAKLGHDIAAGQDMLDAAGAWMGGKAKDGVHAIVSDQVASLATQVVGDHAVSAVQGAAGIVGDVMSWANPSAATIGSTNGDRGRAAARLIAARIRQIAGLPLEG